jgi:hypothetical protein
MSHINYYCDFKVVDYIISVRTYENTRALICKCFLDVIERVVYYKFIVCKWRVQWESTSLYGRGNQIVNA